MGRTLVVFLATIAILTPALAVSADESAVAVDARVLTNAIVERNGKNVGKVERVMVNPTTGRIDHVDILMTEGASRTISVPWTGVSLYQNHGGHVMLSLTNRAAAEASPSAGPRAPGAALNVSTMQQLLANGGYYSGPVDGVPGPGTYAALRAFQRHHGLRVTGRADWPTVRALTHEPYAAAAPAPPAPPASYPAVSSAIDVRTAQQALRDRGYYSGPVDGELGPVTYASLRAYQRDRGLPMTGRLDSSTARQLNIDRSMAAQS